MRNIVSSILAISLFTAALASNAKAAEAAPSKLIAGAYDVSVICQERQALLTFSDEKVRLVPNVNFLSSLKRSQGQTVYIDYRSTSREAELSITIDKENFYKIDMKNPLTDCWLGKK